MIFINFITGCCVGFEFLTGEEVAEVFEDDNVKTGLIVDLFILRLIIGF
ncbi:hypothetical protein UFOVP67_8 [uncultured Caudovirales phage]|uniref:Uncharacterized protein n=1 Tax=uncultured Caudovirales phage TaxID=2100421 RepID=A0A6J5T8J7_9CAUD|nr:hypothetical protein UFOVP67_8 [uncultured Caudovirales phage]